MEDVKVGSFEIDPREALFHLVGVPDEAYCQLGNKERCFPYHTSCSIPGCSKSFVELIENEVAGNNAFIYSKYSPLAVIKRS